jgi:hypothetical protein
MSMTQTVASDYHQIFSDKIANVSLSKGTDVGTFFFVLVVVGIALLAHKSWRWRWLRYVGYGLALVWYATISIIAVSYIDRSSSWLNGLFASDYWVTTCVDVYGGTLLLLLSAAVILSRIVAYAGRHAVAWRGPQAS